MSKIAENKALEAYPICNCYNEQCMIQEDVNFESRIGYEEGYNQAMQDMVKDSDHLKYLSDEMGYAYACGCRKTMQDFLEKACEWWSTVPDDTYGFNPCKIYVEQFKNHMQDEI